MERKTKILSSRPVSAARDRPEFGFSALVNGSRNNDPNPSGSGAKQYKGIRGRDGVMRKSSSFCGRSPFHGEAQKISSTDGSALPRQAKSKRMRRPKTYPELLNRDKGRPDHQFVSELRPLIPTEFPQVLAAASNASKLLVNVTVLQSIGALRVLVSKDATVQDVIKAALVLYAKEGRRPLLSTDPASFGLHYSQFSMNSLNPTDRVEDLGSRNFFVCPSNVTENARITSLQTRSAGISCAMPPPSCGAQTQTASRFPRSWCRVMNWIPLIPSSSQS